MSKISFKLGRTKSKHEFLLLLLVVLMIWITWGAMGGCAWFMTSKVDTAEELATKGMEQFADRDYRDALKAFTTLKERYPYSRYAILAELKVADAHFRLEEYPEAIAAYDDFARLHPKNEAIPYVLYQIGDCYFEQMLSLDRDQTPTRQAILAFERLVKAHPSSTHAGKAKERIRTCRERLAKHELYVGRFYYKSKEYRAALGRFEGVLLDYSDALSEENRREIKELIASCQERMVETN